MSALAPTTRGHTRLRSASSGWQSSIASAPHSSTAISRQDLLAKCACSAHAISPYLPHRSRSRRGAGLQRAVDHCARLRDLGEDKPRGAGSFHRHHRQGIVAPPAEARTRGKERRSGNANNPTTLNCSPSNSIGDLSLKSSH